MSGAIAAGSARTGANSVRATKALVVLAHLRNGDTCARLAAGFGIGLAAVYRYIRETVDLLAAQAPSLTAAVWRLAWTCNNYAILDGTVIRIDRVAGKPAQSSNGTRAW